MLAAWSLVAVEALVLHLVVTVAQVAAVQAGASSAVASLWPVKDVGTGELMDNFYRRYREGRSKSAALRDAQLAMIAKGGPEANPNIWAAFTLLGAWR